MFSNMPLTSHDTQPAMLAICHARGSAVATAAALAWPASHSHTPSAAVPTTRAAFMQVSVAMKRVVMRMCAAMRSRCSTMASRTYESSSAARANSFTVGKLVYESTTLPMTSERASELSRDRSRMRGTK